MAEIITGPSPSFLAQQQQSQPDLVGNLGHLLQLKNLQNEQALAPLRQQALQQQVQAGNLENQQKQVAMQNQQALTKAYQQWDSNNYGDLAHLALKNGATGDAVMGLQQHALQIKDTASQIAQRDAETGSKTLQTQIDKNGLIAGRLLSVSQLPDEQLAKGVSDTLQELGPQLDPQHAQMGQQLVQGLQSGRIPPAQAKQQLDLFRKSFLSDKQIMEDVKTQAETKQAQTAAAKNQMEIDAGGTSDTAKFTHDYLLANNLPNTPANRQKAFQEYTRQTKIVPAQVRVEGIGQMREMPVMDTQNGNALQYLSAADINAANKNQPGRYIPAVEGAKALSKTATIEDIRGNIQAVRENLQNPKMPEFTAAQRSQIAVALGNEHAQDALSAAFRGGVLGSLTPEQQDFLINMAQLKENAMAMRSVLGAGQGSQDLRDAITSTLPGPRNPSKAYGLNQLTKFESVLDRLEKGIPKVPLAQGGGGQPKPNSNNDPLGIR